MAHNSLSPAFVKLYYSISGITHVQTIPVNPSGTPIVGSEPNLIPIGGGTVSLSQFMTDYMAVFRPLFSSLTTVQNADFWYQPTPESDPVWIYSHPINLAGSTGATSNLMSQFVLTFRTAGGGIFRWYGMEVNSAIVVNQRVAGVALTGINLALSNYLKGTTSCFQGRDNTRLIIPIWMTTKYNDALRKRRMLF